MAKGNGKRKAGEKTEKGLTVPEHGGGALHMGAPDNPVAGPGRPPSAIREHCRGSFAQRVEVLEKIVDGVPLPATKKVRGKDGEWKETEAEISASVKERIKALDVLGKYGGVDKLALTVDEQPETQLTPELLQEMWERIQRIRSIKQFERMLIGAVKGDSE